MSISGSLANALTGLTAAARATQVVSSNVANAATEGYGRRELHLSPRSLDGAGAGVRVDAVTRVVDQGILRDRRFADAGLGHAADRAAALTRLAGFLGDPESDSSIPGRLRVFEAALIEAASRPDSDIRLGAVLSAATGLSDALNRASDDIQAERLTADQSIARQVEALNDGLGKVVDLNAQIAALNGAGRDVSALEDARQAAIDRISEIVPVREVPRDDGRVSLYTTGGAILIDDTARVLDFTRVNMITPDMTLASGALSGVTIDGRPAATDGSFAPLAGGTLAAAFEIRDALAPAAQTRLDAFARDLVERFADPAVDPTLLPGDPGLFTDGGSAFDPLDEVGLAGRLSVNALADPAQGGATWRLRDGLGSAAPGEVGNAAGLHAMADALAAPRMPASTAIASAQRTAFTLAGDLLARASLERISAEDDQTFAAARQSALRDLELQGGVDTDQELQKLILIEQNYAANARVIQTVDALIQDLLAI